MHSMMLDLDALRKCALCGIYYVDISTFAWNKYPEIVYFWLIVLPFNRLSPFRARTVAQIFSIVSNSSPHPYYRLSGLFLFHLLVIDLISPPHFAIFISDQALPTLFCIHGQNRWPIYRITCPRGALSS